MAAAGRGIRGIHRLVGPDRREFGDRNRGSQHRAATQGPVNLDGLERFVNNESDTDHAGLSENLGGSPDTGSCPRRGDCGHRFFLTVGKHADGGDVALTATRGGVARQWRAHIREGPGVASARRPPAAQTPCLPPPSAAPASERENGANQSRKVTARKPCSPVPSWPVSMAASVHGGLCPRRSDAQSACAPCGPWPKRRDRTTSGATTAA